MTAGQSIGGAIPVGSCAGCLQPVTRCTALDCTGHGYVHVRSRLHRCGSDPFRCAIPLAVAS